MGNYNAPPAPQPVDLAIGGPHRLAIGQAGFIYLSGVTVTNYGLFNVTVGNDELYQISAKVDATLIDVSTGNIGFLFDGIRQAANVQTYYAVVQGTTGIFAVPAGIADTGYFGVGALHNGIVTALVATGGVAGKPSILATAQGERITNQWIGDCKSHLISGTVTKLGGICAFNGTGIINCDVGIVRVK